MIMAVEAVRRLAVKQTLMRRRVGGGRRRRTGGVGPGLGPGGAKEKGIGQKNAQNGIRVKHTSMTTSASYQKIIISVCLIEIRPKEKHNRVDR